jgi:hypothetical protein
MNVIIVICYVICAYGLANMIVYAEGPWNVFEMLRQITSNISEGFGKLFTCMMCFSTWIGLLFSGIDLLFPNICFTPFNLIISNTSFWWLILLLDAAFTSGAVWLIHNLEEACERHGVVYFDEEEKADE